MLNQTRATQTIINRIRISLSASCVSCPDVMIGCILDEAQELVSQGYVWDVALAIACRIYPCTSHCATYAYR